MPPKASAYFKNGAGKGPGLSGSGSQNAGAESPGTATAGSGQATATGTSTSKSVAGGRPADFSMGPLACGLVVLLSSFLGATLL